MASYRVTAPTSSGPRYWAFDRVPQVWNPRSGLVFNSNNSPMVATGAYGEGIRASDYPASFGLQTNMTNRAWRALETFGADPSITPAAFRADKFDIAYSPHSAMAHVVAALLRLPAAGDLDIAAAQRLLAGWNLRTDRESRAATLAVFTALPLAEALEAGRSTPVRASLLQAIRMLKSRFGRLDPKWGEVNRIVRGAVDLPIDGGPDTFRAVYGESMKDGRLKAVAGDTFIMFVTWDRGGRLTSESIHQFGAATSRPASPHYADQTPPFAAMRTKPVWFTEAELAGHVAQDYAP